MSAERIRRAYLVHSELALHGIVLRDPSDMPALLVGPVAGTLRLLELSGLARLGVKGPRARALLNAAGLDCPAEPNRVTLGAPGVIVAALSRSEFLLSTTPEASSPKISSVREAWARSPDESYLVEHGESLYCFGLAGARRQDLYARLCSIDFGSPASEPGRVLQTKLARLSTIILRCDGQGAAYDLILGDVSFATFMWRTLFETAQRFGGEAAGIRPL